MNIYLTASKQFYDRVADIKASLEALGHVVTPPNGYDSPEVESHMKELSPADHQKWKAEMIREDGRTVARVDAVLVLNFEKRGQPNYIGGATFLEMFKAFELGKKLFLYNPIPENMLADEIAGFGPVVINGDLKVL
jgi:hypothetical protein